MFFTSRLDYVWTRQVEWNMLEQLTHDLILNFG
jgi:hypothetical protein